MRVAAYSRVSTDEQAKEGFSLDAQERRLRSFADAQGWEIAGLYRDEGHSGRNIKRPAYRKMLEEIDSWDSVIVVKMDRIHRSTRNFIDFMDLLQKQGKYFASATEAFDTATAMGRFVRDIIMRIAQLESEVIGERVFTGMEEKALSKGGSLGARLPYGYLRDDHGELVIDYDAAERIRVLFSWAFKAGTITEAGELVGFDRFQARRILRNPFYAGIIQWNDILQPGTHPALVSVATFRVVQERFKTGVVI